MFTSDVNGIRGRKTSPVFNMCVMAGLMTTMRNL